MSTPDESIELLKSQIERIARVLKFIAVDGPAKFVIHETGEVELRSKDNYIKTGRISIDEFLISFDLVEDAHGICPGFGSGIEGDS